MDADNRERRFHALFESEARWVLGFALRRVSEREDAADIVAETFSVAWRRIDDVPAEPESRPWLYGVARRVLANQRRGALRRQNLSDRLRDELRLTVTTAVDEQDDRAHAVSEALARLPEQDREVLLLANWEGLTPAQVATVIDVPAATARTRLHRARGRLRTELEASGQVVGSMIAAQAHNEEAR
jgi:RNA polymerase sigma-70 factor (ECF subfamily)